MDLSKNIIPNNIKKIHLIAVCGTAMGALACMLKDMGFDVTGSDQGVYPPMSDFLAHKGVAVTEGFSGKNLAYRPDLVIVGNAVSKTNPEAIEIFELGLPFCSMPQAVNHFLAKGKKSFVITGTHGKTTTSSLFAWIFHEAGLDPSFMIGGILKDFKSNYRVGKGDVIVIEGDEYDTAFFDKGPKFLHYSPYMAVVTSVEFDHADIFRDTAHVKQAFDAFISRMSADSTLLAFAHDDNVSELVRDKSCHVVRYGRNSDAFWHLGEVSVQAPSHIFEVLKGGKLFGKFKTKLVGEHNLFNALSVIAIADAMKIPPEVIGRALETFQSVKRRQEVRGEKRGVIVMDDFAHHPTAVRETIRAVRPFYPKGRIVAVFEPRTNSSMRKVFQNVYPLCFDDADVVCIRKPSRLDKIPPEERFSSEKLVQDLKLRGKEAYHFEDTDAVIAFLLREAKPGDLLLIMSNGGFDNIHERLLRQL
jgi:UDP-N-acetylmuramate: L-alanyl-gamma-D-glutamyl-meso-diaminopimelate ligase